VVAHSASQRQQWITLNSGQLKEQGTDICLGVLPASSFRVITVSCSNTPLTTIAFAHPFASKLFRPLGLQRRHLGNSRHRLSSSSHGSSKYEQNDHNSRLDAHGAQVVIRVNRDTEYFPRCLDRVSANELMSRKSPFISSSGK
jgi:hypothetical protein